MPVPCQTPCEMCGDVDCICKLSNIRLLKDCDTKIDIDNLRNVKLPSLKALSTDDKDLPSWTDSENPIC